MLEKILFINSPIISSIKHKLISEGTIIVRRVPGPTGICDVSVCSYMYEHVIWFEHYLVISVFFMYVIKQCGSCLSLIQKLLEKGQYTSHTICTWLCCDVSLRLLWTSQPVLFDQWR